MRNSFKVLSFTQIIDLSYTSHHFMGLAGTEVKKSELVFFLVL